MRVVLSSGLDDELLLGKSLRAHVDEIAVPDGAWVVLDPRCPLVPEAFVAELVARVTQTGLPHVGVRPVTDTVKVLADGVVGETLDRDALRCLAAPLVLASEPPSTGSMAELVASLEGVVLVEAPPLARRVGDRSEIRLLEALARTD